MRHQNDTPPSDSSEPSPPSQPSTTRQRWWRLFLLSAVIQGILLLIAWHAVQTRQHSERSTPNDHITAVTAVQSTPTANEAIPTMAPDYPSGNQSNNATSPEQPAPKKATPRSTTQRTLPNDNLGAQVVLPRDKITTPNQASTAVPASSEPFNPKTANSTNHANRTEQNSAIVSNATASNPTQTNSPLLNVPIAAQSLSYRVLLSDGLNTTELPPARLVSTHLGAQRYSVSLSNGTAQAGAGNFGWTDTFLMTEHGLNPLEIGGGLYLKTGESPLRLTLGLGLHDDGKTWHWGKKANSGTRTHAYFLDRVSLIAYVQGALNRSPTHGATQWILPLASERAVRDVAVNISPVSAPDVAIQCQPCVQAQVRAHLGEMNYWSVWYDGAHHWRPVMMRMRLAHPQGQTLTLTLQ